jgi:uncharacterized membrane protein HdeD (DUF308 family)
VIAAAWALFALGVVHIVFGLIRFRRPLAQVVAAGFVGKFAATEERRTAFWFLLAGPLLMGLGQITVHAVTISDLSILRIVGIYLLVSAGVGVAAFPKSPLWAPLLLSPLFIASGFRLFAVSG